MHSKIRCSASQIKKHGQGKHNAKRSERAQVNAKDFKQLLLPPTPPRNGFATGRHTNGPRLIAAAVIPENHQITLCERALVMIEGAL